ncbi:hypothetical protein [Streptomyces sp. ODS28]|uniref:hypothetical protein n=1 Tax=Streptomyces sp. ODS28 TaxID=3136688 RepID=UPI0031ED0CBC
MNDPLLYAEIAMDEPGTKDTRRPPQRRRSPRLIRLLWRLLPMPDGGKGRGGRQD